MKRNKIKVGDRVMCTDDGNLGVFKEIDDTGYVVTFDYGVETWLEAELIEQTDEPYHNKADEFTNRLIALMDEFGAEIIDCATFKVDGCEESISIAPHNLF